MRTTFRRIWSPALCVFSALLIAYPLLHAIATWRAWGTSELPAEWPVNLGIALIVGAAGVLLCGPAWRSLCAAYAVAPR